LSDAPIKRGLALGALVVALAVPSAASAAARTYHGTVTDDPAIAVTLKAKKVDGKRYVTGFKATNLPITCSEGTVNATLSSVGLSGKAKVKPSGKFTASASNAYQTFKVTGKLTKSSATGTLRYSGFTNVDGETYGCDSGFRNWSATR
jgi:hypothetical protein